jgi:hypothetical protein
VLEIMQIEAQNGILVAGGLAAFPSEYILLLSGEREWCAPYLTLSKHVRTALSCVGISVERSKSLRLPGLIKLE